MTIRVKMGDVAMRTEELEAVVWPRPKRKKSWYTVLL